MGDRIFQKLADSELLRTSPIFVFAADAQVSVGLQGLGTEKHPRPHYRTRPEFLDLMRAIAREGHVDGVLMNPADAEVLAQEERLFDSIPVTPMVRMNAETNIWSPRFGQYRQEPSLPFQTIQIDDARYCNVLIGSVRSCHVSLGLYSITLNNDVVADERTLDAYLHFARQVGEYPDFHYVLEVFLPNVNIPGMDQEARGKYVADSIVRTMSYLRKAQRPQFIKTEFTTPAVWRELISFDPTLVIGALGGPRQSTRKTLELAHEVTECGGRAILFGRTVFGEDDPRLIAEALRGVLDRQQNPDQALREYQAALRAKS